MGFVYKITISIDVGDAIDSVGALMKEVNNHMSSMGFDEQVGVTSKVLGGTLKCDRKLSSEEQKEVCRIMRESIEEQMSDYKFSVQCERSQPRESCSQTV